MVHARGAGGRGAGDGRSDLRRGDGTRAEGSRILPLSRRTSARPPSPGPGRDRRRQEERGRRVRPPHAGREPPSPRGPLALLGLRRAKGAPALAAGGPVPDPGARRGTGRRCPARPPALVRLPAPRREEPGGSRVRGRVGSGAQARGRTRTGHGRGPGDRAAGALPRVPGLAPPDRPHEGPEPGAGRGPPAAWRGPRGAAGGRVPAAPPRAAARGAAAGGPLGPRPARGVGRARGDGRTVPDNRGPRTAGGGALPVRARVRRRAPQRPAPVRRAPGSCHGPPRPRPRGRAPCDADRRKTAAVHPRGVRAPL